MGTWNFSNVSAVLLVAILVYIGTRVARSGLVRQFMEMKKSASVARAAGQRTDAPEPVFYKLVSARHGPMLVNPNDQYVGQSLIQYREFSEREEVFIGEILRRTSGLVIEVGSNIGAHTVPMAKLLAVQGRTMLAFEPQQVIFQNMCANLALNGLMNVKTYPFACGEKSEILYFRMPDYSEEGNFGGVSLTQEMPDVGMPVQSVRLDDVVDPAGVGMIKIDVEGFELQVLKGASGILAKSRPILYLENDRLEKAKELIEWLWTQGYKLWWHVPPLFNPDNLAGRPDDIFGDVSSCNMLAIPGDNPQLPPRPHELRIITDPTYHPVTAVKAPASAHT
jgi:FkbM family methyltransferase